jgi:hypothetical protein
VSLFSSRISDGPYLSMADGSLVHWAAKRPNFNTRNVLMIRPLLALSVLAAVAFISPAFAADKVECTDANMMKMQTEMKAMTDKSKQEMAMKEMAMAEDMMKQNKMDDCSMHMDNAIKEMQK